MVVSLPQEGDWKAVKQYIKEEQVRTSTLKTSDITKTDPETWPVAHTFNNPVRRFSFSVNQTTQEAHHTADWKGPKNTTRSRVAVLRFGMSLSSSPWAMDI